MYTNAGILAMMEEKDVGLNLVRVQLTLQAIEAGEKVVTVDEFNQLVNWEENMKTYFVQKAEAYGVTNVLGNDMRSF